VRRVVFALALLLVSSPALALDKKECARTGEDGQRDRADGKLVRARTRFVHCAQEECPDVVRHDCLKWLDEIEAQIPSIVVVVQDDRGEDIANARATVDDAPVEIGKATPLDPGKHTVRASVGATPITKEVHVAEGVKGRIVRLELERSSRPLPPPPPPSTARPVMPWVFVGTGTSLVAITAFLGIGGLVRAGDMADTCKPNCNEDEVADIRTQFRISYVTGAVGAILLGVGAYLLAFKDNSVAPPR
jgi:hypothetical protein